MAETTQTDQLTVEFIDWYYPGIKSGGPVISLHNELIKDKFIQR